MPKFMCPVWVVVPAPPLPEIPEHRPRSILDEFSYTHESRLPYPHNAVPSSFTTAGRVAPADGRENEDGSRREASADGKDRSTTASGARGELLGDQVDR
jgi:hypothetical protein